MRVTYKAGLTSLIIWRERSGKANGMLFEILVKFSIFYETLSVISRFQQFPGKTPFNKNSLKV